MTGAGRDGNRNFTTEKAEIARIVLLTIVKEGIVRIAHVLMPTMKEANARSVRTVTALMATVPNVLLTIVKVEIVRIALVSITIMKEVNVLNVLNRDGNSYDRPQRPRFNANRDGGSYGDRPQRPALQ